MIAVDASVAAKWVLAEEYSAEAEDLLHHALTMGEQIVAPPLLPIEVTNTLWQRVRREGLSLDGVLRRQASLLAVPIRLVAPDNLYRRALQLAQQYDLPAAYDAHYLAVAELLGCELWTDDRRMLRALRGRLAFVRAIADYTV